MKHQLDILDKVVEGLKKNKAVTGIMVMGSVADGTANEFSDLDIMILCNTDKFEATFIDGILVEYIYLRFETALYKLQNSDMEVYRYINSKILYDNGQLQELATLADTRYRKYKIRPETKKSIYHWLLSVKYKLAPALEKDNLLKTNYLTSINSWKLIEAIWIVNDKPLPPSGSVIKFLGELHQVPDPKWFEKLFLGSDTDRSRNMMAYIEWVLPRLKKK
jgi:predicted nucleotidyltransferase